MTFNKSILTALATVLFFSSCTVTDLRTGIIIQDNGWLMTGDAPYTLKTVVKGAKEGNYELKLVRDLSLMDEQFGKAPAQVVLEKDACVGPEDSLIVELGNLEPGFYQLRLGNADTTFTWNIGIKPEDVVSAPDSQPDFDSFWEETFSELAQVPLEPEYTKLDEYSNEYRTCYEVRYKSFGGAVSGGIISIPNEDGKYPVSVDYMGYGAPVFYYDPSSAPKRIQFLVSVRDQGIFKEGQERWIDRGLESRETFYYRGAFCDVRRAIEFVLSLDKADAADITVTGESQGGAFATVAAAVSPEVRAASAAVPFLGDYPDYAKIVWWPMHEVFGTKPQSPELMEMLSYFDVKNFAPKVKCPYIMAFGLQDPTCPPHTNFAIYNNIGSSVKQWVCVPTCGHAMWMEPDWPPIRDAFLEFAQ